MCYTTNYLVQLFCSAFQWLVYLLVVSGLDLIGKCIGEEAKYEGIRLLFDGMQQPVLNKQVTWNTCETFHWVEHFLKWKNGYGRGLTHSVQKTKSNNVALAYSSWLADAICFISFQLTYVLLDIGIQELFPELSKVCTNSIQELQIASSYYCSFLRFFFFCCSHVISLNFW